MKKFIILSVLVFTAFACEKTEELPIPVNQENAIEIIQFAENSHLRGIVGELSNVNGRSDLLNQVDFSEATKFYDEENGVTKYTFSMTEQESLTLQNFILFESDEGDINGLIFTHTLDEEWYTSQDVIDWTDFTGTFKIENLEGEVISESWIENGESPEVIGGGRSAGSTCVTRYYMVTVTYDTYVNGVYSSTTSYSYPTTSTTCYSSGGSGYGFGDFDGNNPNPDPQRDVLRPDGIDYDVKDPKDEWPADLILLTEHGGPIEDITNYLKCFDKRQGGSITIYVDQPNPGTRDTWIDTDDSLLGIEPDVGHTFISIEQGGQRRVLGFYPENGVSPGVNPSSNSILVNDGSHEFDVSISFSLNSPQFNSLLSFVESTSSTYNLNSYNCTDFGLGAAEACNLQIPDSFGSWPFGGGSNPGDLGEDIRNLSGNVNTEGGIAEPNTGSCD